MAVVLAWLCHVTIGSYEPNINLSFDYPPQVERSVVFLRSLRKEIYSVADGSAIYSYSCVADRDMNAEYQCGFMPWTRHPKIQNSDKPHDFICIWCNRKALEGPLRDVNDDLLKGRLKAVPLYVNQILSANAMQRWRISGIGKANTEIQIQVALL